MARQLKRKQPKEDHGEEKRAVTRIAAELTGIATLETEEQAPQTMGVTARDISEDGAYLWAKTCPRIGDTVKLYLQCSSELRRLNITLEADGTVVRVNQSSKSKCGFAIKFAKKSPISPKKFAKDV
ncbi:PilZ domain-containing protein [Acidobacteria bacterium AH-259-G07]|nr:PilZ domain-containing protein [Acidobacteria bacterium AH-259-G07]